MFYNSNIMIKLSPYKKYYPYLGLKTITYVRFINHSHTPQSPQNYSQLKFEYSVIITKSLT